MHPYLPVRIAAFLWLLVIAALTMLPWRFVGHPHWAAIDWVPFVGPSSGGTAWVRDAPLNVLLFLPFGALLMRQERPRRLRTVVLLALGVSLGAEFFQVFCHGRFPSINDVMTNVSGAAAGAWTARRLRQ